MYHKLFIYGTLLQGKTQLELFGQKAIPFAKAILKDWEKSIAGQYPIIRPAKGKTVKGKIIHLTKDQMTQADAWEECPEVYQRERVTVQSEDGSYFNVWTYTRKEI